MRQGNTRRFFIQAGIAGYSQWFAGKSNNVAGALSREWHCNKEELTFILCSHFPEQMPENFSISQLPNEINSWLISLLQQLPVSEQLRELHMTTGLKPGSGGRDIASLLDATTPSLTGSVTSNKIMLGAFSMAVREGRFSKDCTEPLVEGTVLGAISHVVQAF